jgi:hypothetical protein
MGVASQGFDQIPFLNSITKMTWSVPSAVPQDLGEALDAAETGPAVVDVRIDPRATPSTASGAASGRTRHSTGQAPPTTSGRGRGQPRSLLSTSNR